MVSIIISGPPAVGKTSLAEALTAEFGLKLMAGGDVLKDIARSRGYKVGGSDWWDTPEGMKFLGERSRNHEIDRQVDETLKKMVKDGGVVVTSYTLPWLTKDGLKIWLEASTEKRAIRMVHRDGVGYEEAIKVIEERDRSNRNLYRALYGMEFGEDLTVFDLVLNSEDLSKEQVTELAVGVLKHLVRVGGEEPTSLT